MQSGSRFFPEAGVDTSGARCIVTAGNRVDAGPTSPPNQPLRHQAARPPIATALPSCGASAARSVSNAAAIGTHGATHSSTDAAERVTMRTLHVDEVCQSYLSHVVEQYSPRTALNIAKALQPLVNHAARQPASSVSPQLLYRLQDELGRTLAARTVNTKINWIKAAWTWAERRGLVSPGTAAPLHAVPAVTRTSGGRHRSRQTPTPAEVERLYRSPHACAELSTLTRLLAATGMRAGEGCGIDMSQVEAVGQVWWYRPQQHKTSHRGRERAIPITGTTKLLLHDWSRRTGRTTTLFRYTPSGLLQAMRRICSLERLPPITPQSVRRMVAEEARRRMGTDYAAALLGHASTRVTERHYLTHDLSMAQRAAESLQRSTT